MMLRIQAIDEPSPEAVQLSAQTLHVSTRNTIAQVKSMIELQDSGIPAEGIMLLWIHCLLLIGMVLVGTVRLCIPKQGRNMLLDSDSLESLQISDGDMLNSSRSSWVGDSQERNENKTRILCQLGLFWRRQSNHFMNASTA